MAKLNGPFRVPAGRRVANNSSGMDLSCSCAAKSSECSTLTHGAELITHATPKYESHVTLLHMIAKACIAHPTEYVGLS